MPSGSGRARWAQQAYVSEEKKGCSYDFVCWWLLRVVLVMLQQYALVDVVYIGDLVLEREDM